MEHQAAGQQTDSSLDAPLLAKHFSPWHGATHDAERAESECNAAPACEAEAEDAGMPGPPIEALLVEFQDPEKPRKALTFRAVAVGIGIGTLLAFSNMYFGLQTGFITMGALQAAIVGFGIFRVLQGLGFCRDFTMDENVILQAASGATATMPLAAGMVVVLPALGIMTPEQNPPTGPLILSAGALLLWSLSLAFMGTFMAVPLRQQTIVREKLRFPSGTATANIIATLHGIAKPVDDGDEQDAGPEAKALLQHEEEEGGGAMSPLSHASRQKQQRAAASGQAVEGLAGLSDWTKTWATLLWTFVGSFAYSIAAAFVPALQSWYFCDWVRFSAGTVWGWVMAPSLGYAGQGMIMGPKTCASMLLGALVGYAVLGPYSRNQGYAPGPIGDITTGATGWILWVSLAVMLGDSFCSLAILTVTTLHKQWLQRRRRTAAVSNDPTPLAYRVPTWWWTSGIVASIGLCTAIMTPLMGVPVYQPAVAGVVAVLVAILAVRALGETDLNPVTGIGNVGQVLFAVIAPGRVVPNLVASAVVQAGAQHAGAMMQDFKTAHLLGVSPRAQFWAMLAGSAASIFISTGAYILYTSAFQVPGPNFPAPAAIITLDMAMLVNGGKLPPHVLPFAGGAAVIAALIPLIAARLQRYRTRHAAAAWALRLMPSGIAFAVGMYVAPRFTLPRVAGAIFERTWFWLSPGTHSRFMIVVASGMVLGEGTASIVNAVVSAVQSA